ncbi:MAG: PepSY-like domain-containing protein, partial [Paraprevotella sp.]|nr:PepSY-like domain-containing protein [Paraprevotella sp.]
MKKFLGFIALALWAFVSVNAGDKVTRNVSKLPVEAQKSISSNFPGQEISYIKIDRELLKGTIYEVVLVNGTEVDFTSNGQWKEVDCKKSAVPNAFILGLSVVVRHHMCHLTVSDQNHHLLRTRDRRIKEISRQQHRRPADHGHHHYRKLAALALVHRQAVGQLQRVQLLFLVRHKAFVVKA